MAKNKLIFKCHQNILSGVENKNEEIDTENSVNSGCKKWWICNENYHLVGKFTVFDIFK